MKGTANVVWRKGSVQSPKFGAWEFVIGDGSHSSPINNDVHLSAFVSWMEKYPAVHWNTKAKDKECNPDISTKIELADFGSVSAKFHLMPLENVIKFELASNE